MTAPPPVLEDDFNSKVNFWKRKLRGISGLQFPILVDSTSNDRIQKSTEQFADTTEDFSNRIKTFSALQRVTTDEMVTAIFATLLHRYTQQEDIALLVRLESHKELLLRLDVTGTTPFSVFLRKISDEFKLVSENYLSPADIVAGLKTRGTNLNIEQTVRMRIDLALGFPEWPGDYDILFLVDIDTGAIDVRANTGVADKIATQSLINHFKQLVLSAFGMPDNAIGVLPMLTIEEYNTIVNQFNDTEAPYSQNSMIFSAFEQMVSKAPSAVALVLGDEQLTYRELNSRANKIAHYLISQGARAGDNIGIVSARNFDMIAGLLGILKAGGAYIPIDPEYPQDRQEFILTNSSAKLVITDIEYSINQKMPTVRFLNLQATTLNEFGLDNLSATINPAQLAYTIYTSGSTGRPKGVMITHRSAVNLIEWVNKRFTVVPTDKLLFVTSMCFDLSVYDIFGTLSAGATIVIANRNEVQDVRKLPDLIEKYGITFWDSVPTTFDFVVRGLENRKNYFQCPSLRLVFMSGDWIPVNLPERIHRFFPAAEIISLGGATEGTVWSNYFPVRKVNPEWKSIPYGRPISNNTFYILNEQLQPVPFGVTGELFIGGAGVAEGYAADAEKTAYAYLPDPFHSQWGGRMYRTGDMGRMKRDLNMEFVGRKDNQVKIRGFRVELGEIESVIQQSETVERAIVLASKDKDGVNRLVGYVVVKGSFDRDKMIAFLRSRLPEYMVPALWCRIDEVPVTQNGKIDRKALPEPETAGQLKNVYAPPTTAVEKTLDEIWQKVLAVRSVGIDDNFFDLGGQSLLAVELTHEVEEKLGKKINIYTLFKYPTIRELAIFLQAKDGERSLPEKVYKSLVPIRSEGKKMPIYVVHGDGMNVANFGNLAASLDEDQPVFSIQPKGMLEGDEPSDDLVSIAREYVDEILDQNPTGPYALAGYSFGGYVAVEMLKYLQSLGKDVRMLAIFDTNAENTEYNRSFLEKLPRKIMRQIPKFGFIAGQFLKDPATVINYQVNWLKKKFQPGIAHQVHNPDPSDAAMTTRLENINQKHSIAFRNYFLLPFDGYVHLFKARTRLYFVDDFDFLGWKKYARKGVSVYDVPGDHKTMFMHPNVAELGRKLQEALDSCNP